MREFVLSSASHGAFARLFGRNIVNLERVFSWNLLMARDIDEEVYRQCQRARIKRLGTPWLDIGHFLPQYLSDVLSVAR